MAALALLLATACSNRESDYLGDWVEQHSDPQAGFCLGSGGLAASIGHPDTQYLKWNVRGKNLMLHGKRYSEGTATSFVDTLVITHFTGQQMTTWNKERKQVFVRPWNETPSNIK